MLSSYLLWHYRDTIIVRYTLACHARMKRPCFCEYSFQLYRKRGTAAQLLCAPHQDLLVDLSDVGDARSSFQFLGHSKCFHG